MTRRLLEGGRIDRGRPLAFTFDGRTLDGLEGDTLASALLANGITTVGRSFKYHRPRGIYTAGPEEPNALLTLGSGGGREPNIPATTVELTAGIDARSQNRWPSLGFDLQAANALFALLLPAGFYYKTFMGPTRRAWRVYERFIRRAAGLGRASTEPDHGRYETAHAFSDVAVVGAGPAGLAAALTAARSGARVALVEQDFALGGTLLSEPLDGAAAQWLASVTAELASLPNVRTMMRTTAFGLYDGGTLGLLARLDPEDPSPGRARQRLVMLRAKTIVFATGAIERPLVVPGNDRPGVMLASAARTYAARFAVLAGRRVVVATDGDSAYRAACDLARAGAEVTIADRRAEPPARLADHAGTFGIEVRTGAERIAIEGRRRARAVRVGDARLDCDLVCLSGGWSPAVHLTSHLGTKPRYAAEIDAFVPGALPAGLFSAGAVTGRFGTRRAIEDGVEAGRSAAEQCGYRGMEGPEIPDLDDAGEGFPPLPSPTPRAGKEETKAFVDIQNDVTVGDIRLAYREGYQSVEHLKRYTTLGMGTDQGKTSGFNGLAVMAGLRDASIPDVGTTTYRPPYAPVAIGALAGRSVGRHFRPIRRTPMHDWHVANGAEMIEVGLWQRPWFYRTAGATVDEAYVAEMRSVREAAGICDISTLGKIDVQGPDAALFLDRVYVNAWSSLVVGRARYGVMLRDDGVVMDDGTTTRLAEHRFFMTTSTAKAADVMSWLEFLLETAWPDLRVNVTSLTDDWAAMSVAGPRSREVLSAAFPDIDIADESVPHMGALDLPDLGLRVLRLSYSGERAYEVYAAATQGAAVWERILEAGKPLGLRPYGVEALGALRVEKGHAAGPEIDGRTTLEDLGLGRMASRKKAFVGQVLAQRAAFQERDRPRLVGLDCLEPGRRLRPGAVLFAVGDPVSGHGRGRVTSTTFSPTLGRSIALGLYESGTEAVGREVIAVYPLKQETVRARIVSPVFLDPDGERMRG